MIADNFDLAPAFTLALLRTITLVTGRPPIKLAAALPTPCENNSLLVLVTRLSGSRLSIASMLSNVSSEAIRAINAPYIITFPSRKPLKSGNVKKPKNSAALFATGILTRCSFSAASLLPVASQI